MSLLQAGLSRRSPILLPAPLPAHSDCVQWGTLGPVAVGIVMEHSLHIRFQHEHRHRLRNPIDHIRDTEDPGPTFLGYLHRSDRTREIATRRHAVPQFVETVLQPLLELFDRHAVGPGRSAVPLHLQPRIPHQPLGDVIRLALQPRLTHATPSLSVDHIRSPGRPRPFAPQPTAIRGRITATTGESAGASGIGTLPLTDSAAWSSPSRRPALNLFECWPAVSGRAFTCSTREPGLGSCCLYAGHHLGSKRISPRFFPEHGADSGLDVI